MADSAAVEAGHSDQVDSDPVQMEMESPTIIDEQEQEASRQQREQQPSESELSEQQLQPATATAAAEATICTKSSPTKMQLRSFSSYYGTNFHIFNNAY